MSQRTLLPPLLAPSTPSLALSRHLPGETIIVLRPLRKDERRALAPGLLVPTIPLLPQLSHVRPVRNLPLLVPCPPLVPLMHTICNKVRGREAPPHFAPAPAGERVVSLGDGALYHAPRAAVLTAVDVEHSPPNASSPICRASTPPCATGACASCASPSAGGAARSYRCW